MFGILEEERERFCRLLSSVQRDGVPETLDWLKSGSFFESPASSKFHDAARGGLVHHSLKVYDIALKLKEEVIATRPDVEEYLQNDSIILCALLHDVCKIGLYKEKDDGSFTRVKRTLGKAHGRLSVRWLEEQGLDLMAEEKLAIRWHMGRYTQDYDKTEWPSDAAEALTHPLTWLIHRADSLSCK